MRPVPVLTYHATNVAGNDYATNDHVALAEDLALLDALGHVVVPLVDVVAAHAGAADLPDKAVAITFDDGTDFDYHDLDHPLHGRQRSMLNVLRDFATARGGTRNVTATAFVIASPAARREMDRECLVGRGWFNDDWWPLAVASGLVSIGNHSWDHNHPSTSEAAARGRAGTFRSIDDEALAHREIREAHDYIAQRAANDAADLFAYPYGESNAFLVEDYFPRGYHTTRTRAAFDTEPAHVTDASSRWRLPRYVCGAHWKRVEDLRHLLKQG